MMITIIIIINHHNHNHDHNQARTAAAAWSTTGSPPTTRSPSTPTSPRSTSTTSRTRTFRMPTPSPFRAMWVYPCHTTMNHEPMSCEKKTIFQNLFPFIPQSCQNVRDRIKCACFNWGHLSARMAHWPAQAWPNISACIPQLPSVGGGGPSSQRWPSRVSLFLEVAKRQRSANVLCIRLHFQFLTPKFFFKQAHCVLKADDQHDLLKEEQQQTQLVDPGLSCSWCIVVSCEARRGMNCAWGCSNKWIKALCILRSVQVWLQQHYLILTSTEASAEGMNCAGVAKTNE